jgi:4-hydroxybenzoate polyprenyltransferase
LAEEKSKPGKGMKLIGFLYGMAAPSGKSIKNKLLGLICLQRPLVAIMGPLMFLTGAFLALGKVPPLDSALLGFIAVYSLTSAEHTIDDFIDKDIDKKKWPTRPLPTETISRRGASVYAISLATFGLVLSFIVFNWQLVVVELIALGLGTLYPFLRDRIGYLSLPAIPALIGIGGWVAFSPDTLFTSPVPWILYLVFASWQAFHILTLPWALTVNKTFIVRPKPRTVAEISVIFSVFTLLLAVLLSFFLSATLIFITVMIIISIIYWLSAVPLVKEPTKPQNSQRAVLVATNYNVVMCVALMFAVL